MSTFQALVYAVLSSLTEFTPLSAEAHRILLAHFTGWALPDGGLLGTMMAGSLAALLIFFRHDWASQISCLLSVVIYRRKPMTLDERLPFFLSLTALPLLFTVIYWTDSPWLAVVQEPRWVAVSFFASAILLFSAERVSKKNRGMFDWNIWDALLLGLGQFLALVPGAGRMLGMVWLGLSRHYQREAIAKYALYSTLPLLIFQTSVHLGEVDWHASEPTSSTSWLTLGVTFLASFLFAWVGLSGFLRQMQRADTRGYQLYRFLAGACALGGIWYLNR